MIEKPLQNTLFLICVGLVLAGCTTTAPSRRLSATDKTSVATVDGKTISLQDLNEWIKSALFEERMQGLNQFELYDARREFLDNLIEERLLDDAAKKAGVSTKEYVLGKNGAVVSEQEIADFYAKNEAALGGTLDQWRERIQEHLEVELYDQRKSALAEKLKAEREVRILLEAPRITVAAHGASRGPANAPVTIIEFSDYQCPFCQKVHPTLNAVLAKYPEQVRLVYRHFAISSHTRAKPAAHAAECAGEQGKFWEYHDLIFANVSALTDADLEKFAKTAGLNLKEYRRCTKENRFAKKIDQDLADAEAAGVRGTPTFVINGRILTGAKPYSEFERIIEEELAAQH